MLQTFRLYLNQHPLFVFWITACILALLQVILGFRLSEVVRYWYTYQPWTNPDFEQTEADVLECVKGLIVDHAEAMPGVHQLLQTLQNKAIPIGLASSSAMSLIDTVVDKLEIRQYFDILWSAEYEPYGKPHPGIFITTAGKLNMEPTDCLVFEDSVNGVIAAKAARMKCIAVPEVASVSDKRFAIADEMVESLEKVIT